MPSIIAPMSRHQIIGIWVSSGDHDVTKYVEWINKRLSPLTAIWEVPELREGRLVDLSWIRRREELVEVVQIFQDAGWIIRPGPAGGAVYAFVPMNEREFASVREEPCAPLTERELAQLRRIKVERGSL